MADGAANVIPEVRLGVPTLMDLAWLAMHMREDEIAQWKAVTGRADYDADLAARGFAVMGGVSFCLIGRDNRAFAAGGFEEVAPKVWRGWMAGTQAGWDKHWRSITKYARTQQDLLFENGLARRVEIGALVNRTQAHFWYQRGLLHKPEGIVRMYFADGQDMALFARTIKQWEADNGL